MIERFGKWHFDVTWKWNCDVIVVVIPDPMRSDCACEVEIEELYFDSGEDAENCLREHDVFLLKFDEEGEEYSCGPVTIEYDEEFGYYRVVDNPHSHAVLNLDYSSFTFM